MAKHIILTDVALSAADVILTTKTALPQVISGLAADTYSVRNTSAPVSGTVTPGTVNWWTPNALVDIDYDNDRAYINGTEYASIAAARTAGVITLTANNKDVIPFTGLGTSYTIAAKGITSATANPTATELLAGLFYTELTTSYAQMGRTTGNKAILTNAFGAAVLNNSTADLPASTAVRAAIRSKNGAHLAAMNGASIAASTSSAFGTLVNQMVIGDRPAGDRLWSGTITRAVLVNADLTDEQVLALLA